MSRTSRAVVSLEEYLEVLREMEGQNYTLLFLLHKQIIV